MNGQLILDMMHQKLLPRMKRSDVRFLPSADVVIPHSNHYEPIFPWGFHSHPFFEWGWCVENHAFLKIKDQVYRVEAGDFWLLSPGEIHADVYIPSLSSHQVLWCAYRDGIILAHPHTYVPVGQFLDMGLISAVAPPFMPSLLGTLQYELKTAQTYRESVCSGLVSVLVDLMLRAFEALQQREGPEYALGKIAIRVNGYLSQHFREPLAITDIARALHVSPNYLSTLHKQETGKTISQTLTQIRLEHAKRLLLETHLPVHEVAKSVGYASPEHFSRVFLHHEGITPGRYGK